MDLYSNTKVREQAEKIVRDDVLCCVSSLFYGLGQIIHDLNHNQTQRLGVDSDELMELMEVTDYEEPAERHIDEMDRDDLMSYLDDQDVAYEPDENVYDADKDTIEHETLDTLREKAKVAMNDQGAEEFCREFDIEPDRSEVYEHWVVTPWLGRRLTEQGHTVREVFNLTIWGRPTTGQAISMDGVILGIARGMLGDDIQDDPPPPAPAATPRAAQLQAIFDQSRNGCNDYIRHPLTPKLIYTDGVKEVVDVAGAYWLLDIVGTEATPALLNAFDQGGGASADLTIEVVDSTATITLASAGELWERKVNYTDFPEGTWVLELAVDGTLDRDGLVTVLLLPSGH